MLNIKVLGRYILLGLLLATALCITPAIVVAEGGEPHNCEGFNAFAPPPYIGYVTVTFKNSCTILGNPFSGCAFLSGEVERHGSGETIDLEDLVYETGVDLETQFQTHTEADMRGRCVIGGVMGDPTIGNFEIIAAHGLEYDSSGTSFSLYIIAMPLTNR